MINKAKTRQELAEQYGICTKTLKKWLEKENIFLPRGLISPKNQLVIYEKLGFPNSS